MTTRDRAIEAIRDLPESADIQQIIRELSYLAGIESAIEEIEHGDGMNSTEAKEKLREWISG